MKKHTVQESGRVSLFRVIKRPLARPHFLRNKENQLQVLIREMIAFMECIDKSNKINYTVHLCPGEHFHFDSLTFITRVGY